jgi:uncharacterized membrane protein
MTETGPSGPRPNDPGPPVTTSASLGAQPGRNWTKIVMVGSLALNLLFLGILGGDFLHGGPDRRASMVRELNFGPLTEAMSPKDRNALRRAFVDKAPDLAGQRQGMRQDLTDLLGLLRAETFERPALEAVFARQVDRSVDRLRVGQKVVLDLVSAMSVQERADFAGRLEETMKREKGHGGP